MICYYSTSPEIAKKAGSPQGLIPLPWIKGQTLSQAEIEKNIADAERYLREKKNVEKEGS